MKSIYLFALASTLFMATSCSDDLVQDSDRPDVINRHPIGNEKR